MYLAQLVNHLIFLVTVNVNFSEPPEINRIGVNFTVSLAGLKAQRSDNNKVQVFTFVIPVLKYCQSTRLSYPSSRARLLHFTSITKVGTLVFVPWNLETRNQPKNSFKFSFK